MEVFTTFTYDVKIDEASNKRLDTKGAILDPESDYNKLEDAINEAAEEMHTFFAARAKGIAKKHGVQLVVEMDVL